MTGGLAIDKTIRDNRSVVDSRGFGRGVAACVVVGLAVSWLVYSDPAHAQSSFTVGSVRGIVREKTGEVAVGATVIASSPALVSDQTAITDANGQYFITALPPGLYTLTIFYGKTFSRPGVLIRVGKESVVNIDIDTSGTTSEVIEIQGSVPIIDQGSTKTGVTLTDDYTRNVPLPRTFGAVLGAAAGSQTDQWGPSIAGTTSAENVYIVEGINTTDTLFGGLSTNLPNEFLAETEIITGGYNAEYGRATGGIVNVVTKQGSNRFGGSVFGYFRPPALIADAKVIDDASSVIDTKQDIAYQFDIGAELGGPIIKDKLWFHVGFNPSSQKVIGTRIINTRLDDDQDGAPDVDADGNLLHDEIRRSQTEAAVSTYNFTAKVNGAIDQNHQFQLSLFGNPTSGETFDSFVSDPRSLKLGVETGAVDGALKWTSKFSGGKTQIDAVVGHHRGVEAFRPIGPASELPRVRYRYARSLYDFASIEPGFLERCHDNAPHDRYPKIMNCPVVDYISQGSGMVFDEARQRTSAIVAVTRRVRAGGYHVFKSGVDLEIIDYDGSYGFTGGANLNRTARPDGTPSERWQVAQRLTVVRNLAPGEDPMLAEGERLCVRRPGQEQAPNEGARAVCALDDMTEAETRSINAAAYLQDSWQVRPNLTINAGVRWEQQTGYVPDHIRGRTTPSGELVPDTAFELSNLIAPRVGVIYDPTQEGRSRLFGHWGRFYETMPQTINAFAFSGDTTVFDQYNVGRRTPNSGAYDPNCDVDFTNQPPGTDLSTILLQCQDRIELGILGEGLFFVAPGLEAQYTDELIVGAEYEALRDVKLGVHYVHRTLPQVVEDISTDGGNSYLVANPGSDYSDAVADFRQRAETLRASGDSDDAILADELERRADVLDYVVKFDKPQRNYDAINVTLQQRPTRKSLVQASYTYSRLRGNYAGLIATDTGQLLPNLTAVYDLPSAMANRYGALTLDRPHNIKIDGFYAFDIGRGQLVTGASVRALSGISHTPLGQNNPFYGREVHLLPRGAYGRSPMSTQVDVHLSYGRLIDKTTKLELFVRVFDLVNRQTETSVDPVYTHDMANPIVGGDKEDLRHLKMLDGDTGLEQNRTVEVNPNFDRTEARQTPRTIQLGMRLTF